MQAKTLTILHTNDFHGQLDRAKSEFLSVLRASADLYFDSGDCVKTGNLGIPLQPEPVWPLLESLHCDASVPGNRESHLIESAFRAKLNGAAHPILCANMRQRDGSRVLPESLILNPKGVRVGVFGVMVPMVTAKMASSFASAYLWDQPISAARAIVSGLASECDLLIALTHIGLSQDRLLAEACPEIDLILGGHSHNVLTEPVAIGKTSICQTGSHGRFVGRYVWDFENHKLQSYELIAIKSEQTT